MNYGTIRRCLALLLALMTAFAALSVPGGARRGLAEAAENAILIDNGDPGYEESAGWGSSSVKGYNDSSTRVTGGYGAFATWTPAAGSLQGAYKVSLFKVKRPTPTDDPHMRIEVFHRGVSDLRDIDATQGTSGWVELGTFSFDGSGGEYVKLTKLTTAANTFIHADAVKFERVQAGSDASLQSLSVNGGEPAPAFSPAVTAYTYQLTPGTAAVTVTALTYDPAATLRVRGAPVGNGAPAPALALAPGEQAAIDIVVLSADGTETRTYTVTAVRPPEASLARLTLSEGTLSPSFDPQVTSYASEVELRTASVRVTAEASTPGSVVKVNGTAVAAGSPSPDIALTVGANEIDVEVESADGTILKTYTLQVTRKPSNSIVLQYGDGGYSETGSWFTSSSVKGYNKNNTRYTSTAGATTTWKPRMTAGRAAVSFYKVNWPDNADPQVRLDIVHGGSTETRYLNLTPAGEGWIDLGTYDFTGDGNEYVRLTRTTGSGSGIYTRASAVKFEGTIERLPPPLGPLRSRALTNVIYTEKGTIENEDYKVTFLEAAWNGGRTVVRDVYHREDGVWRPMNNENERLEEQWVVLGGASGDRADYYETMDADWTAFDSFSMPDAQTVVLADTSHSDRYALTVTWSLAGARPLIEYALTPVASGQYVVGYQSFTAESLSDVSEVLSGARNHAKMAGTVESTGLWELTAPMSLVEKKTPAGDPFTYGLYIPSAQLPLVFEPAGTAGNQRLGMSLINNEGAVQPIWYAPQYGTYSQLNGGTTYRASVGVYAQKGAVYDAYTDILRTDYGYSAYRENVAAGSLNDAMYNMIDLLKIDPEGDDSVDFVPSLSGWWSRAKGFMDIENPDAIRTAAGPVMLGAYYMTGDDELYENRALPMLEHGVSRNERGWSPTMAPVYGDTSLWKMASVPFDVTSVAAFYDMTRGLNAGLYAVGQEEYRFRNPDPFVRGPVIQPLMTYRMTGDVRYLNEAMAAADAYIEKEIDTPSTAAMNGRDFFYNYGKLWVEILELYEETKEPKYLAAAYKEGKRYASMFVARPVPQGTVSIPQPSPFRYEIAFLWDDRYKFPYGRSRLPEDAPGANVQTDAWRVSPNGLIYEAGDTSAAYRMNAQEAPFLLRLAAYTGDRLLQDIAHNAVIGRYTNYPGYYYRGLIESQQQPEFPLLGPTEGTSIYYHHVPAQLGQTMDYLVTEQMVKSAGRISFPSVFESDFLWFKYHVYGSEPGTFYGHSDAWLWMPKGIIDPGSKQLNWITAESGSRFYIGLSNESHQAVTTSVALNAQLIGFDPNGTYPVTVIRDNGAPEQAVMTNGKIEVTLTAQGMAAIIVEGMNIDVPLHRTPDSRDTSDKSYFFDRYSPIDAVKGMLLVKPDESAYRAYVQAKTTRPATLHYSFDGGTTYAASADDVYPMEWSIPVNDPSVPFTYYVESDGRRTQARTLYLPRYVSVPPSQPAQPGTRPSVIVDNADSESDGSWSRATAANDYYGDNYVTAKAGGQPTSRMRWKPELPDGGLYNVYYKLPVGRSEWASDAAVTVHYDGGEQTYAINEKTTNGDWTLLGKHPFAAGRSGYVEMTNRASAGSVVAADAFMWVPDGYSPSLVQVRLTSDRLELMRSQSAQLRAVAVWDTELSASVNGPNVTYTVDRPDLASIDVNGKLTVIGVDESTDEVNVTASVADGANVVQSPTLTIRIRPLTVIVDSTNQAAYAESGPWKLSGLTGYSPSVRSRYTDTQGATATWKATLPPGRYTASFYNIVRMSGGDESVQVEIKHGTGQTVVTVDAASGTSGWVNLGAFDFAGDGSEYVRLLRTTPTSNPPLFEVYTRADAVKFDDAPVE
ncbi:cadherin-like beta sandwich domain-containing protein [Paenibacillus hodogayensis]|uniref:Cadherin-like beta sandwich domain-containing protein n=1 Tax=Paenibacillus hodogayensis TaxID=279208 RepID=A0ABV5VXB3_9BACL